MKKNTAKQPETFSTNQTNFSAEEPLFESAGLPSKPVDVSENDQQVKKTFIQTKAFKIGAGAMAAFIVLLIAVMIMMMRNKSVTQILEPSPSPMAQQTETDAIQLRINALSNQLLSADPSDDQLPLPPVDLTISLEE